MKAIVNREIERPEKELIDAFNGIPTTIASDAMNKMNAMHAEIKPVKQGTHFVGPAFTVQGMAGCNFGLHFPLYMAKPGDVIVADAKAHKDTAVWGGIMTSIAAERKLAGLVVDGAIRDVAEARKSNFPVFCRAVSPAGPHKAWPDSINVQISCGGVSVSPGDIVIGNDDGVAVVPKVFAREILQKARHQMEEEKRWIGEVKKGKPLYRVLGLNEGWVKED